MTPTPENVVNSPPPYSPGKHRSSSLKPVRFEPPDELKNPTPRQQMEFIIEGKNTPLKPNDTMYLLSTAWFSQFERRVKTATGSLSPQSSFTGNGIPGLRGSPVSLSNGGSATEGRFPIDNRDIVDRDTGMLMPRLVDESDYIMLNEEHWKVAVYWYGLLPYMYYT